LGESLLIVAVAMCVAVFLVGLCLPIFNQVTDKQLTLPLTDWAFWMPAFVGIGIFTALIAGSYPAFFLSSFQAVDVLKNKRMTSGGAEGLRKGLVVFQFVIAICLISSIVIIREQLHFLQSKPLGFNPSHRIMVPLRSQESKAQYSNLAAALQQTTGVTQVSATRSLPSTPMLSDFFAYVQGTGPDQAIALRNTVVDEGYFEALDIPLLAGRGLKYETDSFSWSNTQRYVVVNKACLDMLKIPLDEAIGNQILSDWEGVTYFHEVVGVTDDFHQFSLHQPIAPLLFYIPSSRENYNYLVAEVDAASYARVLEAMAETWKQLVPVTPFEPDFLAESVRRQYGNEERVAQIITGFTTLAILISCLGLYGLSVFVTERRVKEIGVRKVLGGTVTSIITLLSRQFIQLVLIAFFIAVPLGYLAMQQWLQNFAYKITLGLGVFALTGTMAIVLALVTVAYQSVKAATSNPVDSLRSE
jgi:putative ABC transport system permease protein